MKSDSPRTDALVEKLERELATMHRLLCDVVAANDMANVSEMTNAIVAARDHLAGATDPSE